MTITAPQFSALPAARKRVVHLALCERALTRWQAFCASGVDLSYVESVCGTTQAVDPQLPVDAFWAVASETANPTLAQRYQEPLVALQDDDLELPDEIEYAFYAIYNLYRKYMAHQSVDDWLIVNQALAAQGQDAPVAEILLRAIRQAGQG
jgi:hypothetical protein